MFNQGDNWGLGGFQYRQQALNDRIGRISKLHRTKLGMLPGETSAKPGGSQVNMVLGRTTSNSGNGGFDAFINSIAKQESGGNYGARGVRTRWGTALGKYQILDRNIPSWSRAALGRSVSPDEFLRSPQIQEAVARHKLSQYYNKYGAEGAAKAWYGGEGVARKSSNRRNNGGRFPSLNSYARSVVGRMR